MHAHAKTILIADDHPLLAEGLRSLLQAEFCVLGVAGNGRQLVRDAIRLRPDLVITDMAMPELNGIEATKQIRVALPKTRVIFVTQQLDLQYVRAAFRAGASGYAAKQAALEELKDACREVLTGRMYLTPFLRERIGFHPLSALSEMSAGNDALSPRRREILQLIAEGKTSREIGSALHISPKTVEYHKRCLMDETGLRTTAELTRYALLEGLITL